MKTRGWIAASLILCSGGCTVIDGECWPRSEDGQGSGAGGGPIVPGQGGFGDVEPEPQDANGSPPADCASVGQFSPSLFKFVTLVADSGEGKAGGWQKASASIGFVDDRQSPTASWSCPLAIGMPLRAELMGKISAAKAADMSSTVLTYAGSSTMHSRPAWVAALFCIKLRENMQKLFKEAYPNLGATVADQ